ncbi:hypothetical protein, partial [Escherichia coli]
MNTFSVSRLALALAFG